MYMCLCQRYPEFHARCTDWGISFTKVLKISGLANPISEDSWMYPDPNVPLWEIPISHGYLWVKRSPQIPREHNRYHGYTVRGTPALVPPWM